jgi:hypothetical protein
MQESKAAKILAKYHANGDAEPHPLVQFELAQIRHALRLQEEIDRGTSYWSLFRTPGNRKRMLLIIGIAIFSQWSGNGLVCFCLAMAYDGFLTVDTGQLLYQPCSWGRRNIRDADQDPYKRRFTGRPACSFVHDSTSNLSQVFNFAVAVGASFLVDYMGRRTLFIISNSGMLFAFICWSTSEAIFNTMHKTAAAKGKISYT